MADQKKLPVLAYSTGSGWDVVGYASTLSSARKVIRAHLSDGAKSLINTYGFKIGVSLRTPLQRELNGGPEGYIWSLSKTVPA